MNTRTLDHCAVRLANSAFLVGREDDEGNGLGSDGPKLWNAEAGRRSKGTIPRMLDNRSRCHRSPLYRRTVGTTR
jgi:hypothetical protein